METTNKEQQLRKAAENEKIRMKNLIFYGKHNDEIIDFDENNKKHIDYALTQAFLWMEEYSRFNAKAVEEILWKRIILYAKAYHEQSTVNVEEFFTKSILNDIIATVQSSDCILDARKKLSEYFEKTKEGILLDKPHLQPQQKQCEWIRIEDRLPEPNVRVNTFRVYNNKNIIGCGTWTGEYWQSGSATELKITHWQPLPPIPNK